MKPLRPITVLTAAFCLLPAMSPWSRLSAAEQPPEPPPPPLPPEQVEAKRLDHHLEQQIEAMSRAIDSLANQYQELLQQQLGRVQRGLANLPDALDLRLDHLPAVPTPPPAPAPPAGPRSSAGVLTLHSSAVALENQESLREDLLVMARVLERAAGDKLSGTQPVRVMGVELLTVNLGGQPARAVYLEDYGALFSLQVPFPLLPPAPTADAGSPEPGPNDSEWEAARRELYGRPVGAERGLAPNLWIQALVTPGEAYDEAKVQRLQESLLQALGQASRIRGISAQDRILIYVQGATAVPAGDSAALGHGRTPVGVDRGARLWTTLRQGRSVPGATLMTLRVTKADVDAFAHGELDIARFRDKAAIQVYPDAGNPGAGGLEFRGR